MFTCCHPALALEAQVALTLHTLGGLTTAEAARAFLVSEPAMAQRLARAKATAVAARRPALDVLAADTVVVLEGEMLGKPADAAEACAMLRRLSGREHVVITAVALARDGQVWERCDETRVRFRPLSDQTIADYVATGEPLDKAGAYGLQGFGSVLVERIEGDCFGVIGLPLRLVADLLAAAGRPYRFTR
jgi:septum formation protein